MKTLEKEGVLAVYVRRDGKWVDKVTGEQMFVPKRDGIAVPHVISDIPEYRSPIDGRLIGSRSERRDDLKRHNCIDARELPSPTGGKIKNKAFAAKRGLQVSEEYR